MNKKYLYIILLSILIPSQSKVGTTAAQFLGIGVGSRAMSMGGAFTSMIGDPSSLYWNPGTIVHIKNDKFQITNADWLIDTNWLYVSYIYKINHVRSKVRHKINDSRSAVHLLGLFFF